MTKEKRFTESTTVGEVVREPAFYPFGSLLFPVDREIPENMTLKRLSSSDVYLWYSNLHAEKTVEILNDLYERVQAGEKIFYPIYSESEQKARPERQQTGLFYLRGTPGERFAVLNAGGGFYYVAALHDSFPHALEICRRGGNAFVLIYRPNTPWQDLSKALCFIEDRTEELEVAPAGYSLWGGSAGARMAVVLGNRRNLEMLTGRSVSGWREEKYRGNAVPHGVLPQASAVIMQYTGYQDCSAEDAPTYACVGTEDSIASWRGMEARLAQLQRMGIPTEFHCYEGLRHGFGIGTGTAAEGWIDDAIAFWEAQTRRPLCRR